ncbi:MAG: thioredoxin domain-containing protein [Deltaproteobacteria bacterium]|nr:thioredoxin domain-containing protein [Deltaproteobacteria bacterium]MBW1935737.1 thioredoxin domain-containing protein [Deltaproteobacteria bacterium]MBW2300235.1 thioredoxin domain-containing protein [Deltaproteobacteria bacterium]
MLETYPKEVKIVFKNFPLNKHKYARQAAQAALAANEQGKFWDFHNRLFETYRFINNARIMQIARELNLDMAKFNQNLKSQALTERINRDLMEARSMGIRAIPSVFINGKLVRNRSFRGLKTMIEAELKKSKRY